MHSLLCLRGEVAAELPLHARGHPRVVKVTEEQHQRAAGYDPLVKEIARLEHAEHTHHLFKEIARLEHAES